MRSTIHLIFSFLLFLFGFALLRAQTGTMIASGFVGISGIESDAAGNLWVAEVGSGSNDGKISVIRPDGSLDVFLTGLPSELDPTDDETAGAWRTYQLADDRVAVLVGEGTDSLFGSIMIFDQSSWTPGTPLGLNDVSEVIPISPFVLSKGYAESNPYSMTEDSQGNFVIADAAANALVFYDRTADTLGILAEFPPFPNPLPFGPPFVESVPTKVVAKAGGGFYVCELTGFPFATGTAKVYDVSETGEISVFADNLTLLTDMHYDPMDGALTVLQFAAFDMGFQLNSANLIKLGADGSRETLLTDFGPSPSFTFDAAGNIYVTHLFFGQVIKFDAITAVLEEQIPELSEVEIYPNPSMGQLHIQYNSAESTPVWLELYDGFGRLVESRAILQSSLGVQNLNWDLTDKQLPQGQYLLRLRTNSGQLSEQLMLLPR